MFHLLALLSCQGMSFAFPGAGDDKPDDLVANPVTTDGVASGETTTMARSAPVRMPAGEVVTRQCFSGERSDRRYSPTAAQPKTTSTASRSAGAPPPPSAAPPSSMTTPAPVTASSPMAPQKSGAGGGGSSESRYQGPSSLGATSGEVQQQGVTGGYAPMADAVAAAEAPVDASSTRAKASTADGDSLAKKSNSEADLGRRESEKAKDEGSMTPTGSSSSIMAEDKADDSAANLDWGATIYLSNDDSMSLASAQRLLWAIQNKGSVTTDQVRPHEFLNYFSFETTPVAAGKTFSVNAAAEPNGPGSLTLAFAVKGVMPDRQPLDLTLVLDRSGSMSAEGRMEYLKRGLTKMTEQLQRGDRVDFVLFDHEICTPLENFVVGRDNMSLLTNVIDSLQPRGSTDLDAGLQEGYRIANTRPTSDTSDRNRRMLLISDALLNTGNIDPNTVSEVGRNYDQGGIRLTAVGVGRDFNDKVLDMLSEKGKGAYVYLGSEAVVDRIFGVGFRALTETIAHDVHFSLDLPPSLAMEKFYGEEASTVKAEVQPIHYYAGTTQLFLQDLKVRGTPVKSDPIKLTVEFTDPRSGRAETQVFTSTVGELLASDTRNLHKGQALISWTDLILARTLGASPCGAPFADWQDRVNQLGPDAEIQWLDSLTSPLCGASPREPIARAGVPYKVKVDSDLPIAEVTLACGGWRATESLSGSDTIAMFSPQPGSCTLTLQGTVPMVSQVSVPTTGADIRCMVRAGRMNCG